MGYQGGPGRSGAGRASSGRTRGFDSQKKTKAKKAATHHSTDTRINETGAKSINEVVERTTAALLNLGEQTFATPPYHQHYERWLKSLSLVIDDFQAYPQVVVDEAFRSRWAELFTGIEAALKSEQDAEAERAEKILTLHSSKDLLVQAGEEHESKLRDYHSRRDDKMKALSVAVDAVRGELEEVRSEKAGFLERFTKSKATREQEIESRLSSTEKVLESTKTQFADELAKIDTDYEAKRRSIIVRVEEEKKLIADLGAEAERDGSAEARRGVCARFSDEIKALVTRGGAKA